jgi:plasmid stabilization system protein ParE
VSLRYRLTPRAQSDVEHITDFIAQDSVEAALCVHDALDEAFRHLAEMPATGHTRSDLAEL